MSQIEIPRRATNANISIDPSHSIRSRITCPTIAHVKFMTGPTDNSFMAWKWFVQNGERVEGPLSTEDVQKRLQAGHFSATNLIWGPGFEQWRNLRAWTADLPSLANAKPMEQMQEAWHYAVAGQSHGPMPRNSLVQELKALDSVADAMIWTKGMKEWAPLFEFHDLLSDVGVNKRQFPRADLTGKAVLKTAGSTLIAPLHSISEGGFGITLESGLVAGEAVTVELQTAQFREPLHGKAEVRYIHHGVVGMKFTQLSVETRGAIIQFIKTNQMRFVIKAA